MSINFIKLIAASVNGGAANMKKIILSFTLAAILSGHSSQAATTLAAGDVQILGYREDDPDALLFVLWKNIDATTVLSFTDNTYNSTTGWATGEGVSNWMSGTSFSAGTVIRLSSLTGGGGLNAASQGIILNQSGQPSLSAAGDSVTVYQGTLNDPAQVNLYAMDFESSASANLGNTPIGLTVGSTVFLSTTSADNGYYSGTRSFTAGANAAANIASAKTSILTTPNWTKSANGTEAGFLIPGGAGFSTSSFMISPYYQWNAGTGAWNTTSANWLLNGSGAPTSFVSGGDASINGGTLAVQAEGISAGTVNISGTSATVINGGSLTATTINKSGSGTLELGNANNVGTFIVDDASVSGAGSVNASSGIGIGVLTGTTQTISVGLSGAGSLTKAGGGELILSGAKTYTGNTVVGGGILTTGGADVLSDSTAVTIYGGATLKLGGNETVASVAGTASTATLSLQGNTLTVGGAGIYTNTALTTGTGGIVKNGTGLMYLNNENNTYSGGFTLNDGEVQFTASGAAGSGGVTNSAFGTGTVSLKGGIIGSSSTAGTSGRTIHNNVVLNGNVQLGMTSWGTTNAVMNSGGALLTFSTNAAGSTTLLGDSTLNVLGYVQYDQAINGSAYRLTKTGTGASSLLNNYLRLTTSNNIAGVTVNSGILSYKNRYALGTGTLILGDGVTVGQEGAVNNTVTADTIADRTVANNISILGNVTFGVGGTANYLSGNIDLNNATRTLTLQNATYLYGSIANGGLVAQRMDTDLLSSKMFALYGANTYDGGTTVIGVADRTNNLTLGLGNDRALGTGSLTFSGGGTNLVRALTLSTTDLNRTITNNIAIGSGVTVNVETMSSLITVVAGAAVTNNVSVNMALNGVISGDGALVKTNSNTLTLGGANTYAGGTTVNGGTLIGTTASLQGAITNNSAVIFDQSSSGTYGGLMSGTGSLSKTNTGSVTLSATNSYSGATTVSQGTLLVDANGSIASSSLATVNGGLLNINGRAGNVTVNIGGSLGGSGTNGIVTLKSGSFLTPGNSPGTLTAESATVLGGSTYNWEISALRGTEGTNWDLLNVTTLLDMSAITGTGTDKWNLVVTADGAFTGWTDNSSYEYIFAQAANLSLSAAFSTDVGTDVTNLFNITTSGISSNPNGDFKVMVGSANGLTTLNLVAVAVPEPSTGSLMFFGLGGLVLTRLLRRKVS
jgi:fibronectin-binding autotransporter adhesin